MEQPVFARRGLQHDHPPGVEQQSWIKLGDSNGRRSCRMREVTQKCFRNSVPWHKRLPYILDRFFQASTASSDSSASHLNHGLIVASTAATITCTSDHLPAIHSVDQHHHHHIDKHGNLLISPKPEVLWTSQPLGHPPWWQATVVDEN